MEHIMEHYEFISKTDKKSLFNQIKYLVTCAKNSYQNDLATRREHLRELLDADEKVYEDEFIGKIKSRVDENIRERQKSLLALKQQRQEETDKFVASVKIQQNMQNCIEIREELRRKDYRTTQLCQLEQMEEKLRAIAREKKNDEFWVRVQKRITDEDDRRQQHENEAKKNLRAYTYCVLDQQLAEHRRIEEEDRQHLLEEKEALILRMKATDREEKQQARAAYVAKCRDYRKALNTICKQKQQLEEEAETFEDVFHQETMRQVEKEMQDALNRNTGLKEAVMDYLVYVKKFKAFVAEQDKKHDEILDEMNQRYFCYKNHLKRDIAQMKRQTAESTHKVLLKQVCEEQARRAQLEADERENKILENRFARLETNDKFKNREKVKAALDAQLKDIARFNAEKQKAFEQELNRAEEDQLFCEKILDKHRTEGVDYLPPHPNWKLLACYNPDYKQAAEKDDNKCAKKSV